jgi:hypothetical protein
VKSCICRNTSRFLHLGIIVSALAASALQSRAQIVTLSDNNSIAQINPGSQAGMFNWSVEHQSQLAQQWFWYRVGPAGPEHSIDTISAPSINLFNGTRGLSTTYNNGAYSVEVDYSLTGGLAGSGYSDIGESIRINNTSTAPLEFHFFQYSDFDLGGLVGGQTVQLGRNLQGLYNEAFQTLGGNTFSETVLSPGANHGEAGLFNTTLVKLNNGVADTLNDNAGPVGPGDATWAFEWDFLIAPGSSALISKDKYIQLVPEPSALALISVGLAGLALRKRRP